MTKSSRRALWPDGSNSKESMKYIAEEIAENTKLLAEHDLLLNK